MASEIEAFMAAHQPTISGWGLASCRRARNNILLADLTLRNAPLKHAGLFNEWLQLCVPEVCGGLIRLQEGFRTHSSTAILGEELDLPRECHHASHHAPARVSDVARGQTYSLAIVLN